METSTQTQSTTSAVAIRFGLITGLISVIISLALYTTGTEQSPLKWLSSVVLIGGLVLAMRQYKQSHGGYMSYGEGLGIGTLLSAVTGVLSAIFIYVYMGFMDPSAIQRMTDKARSDMEARGGLSDEQIDQGMAMTSKFMTVPALTISVLIGSIIIGFLLSLVISAIIKTSKPEFE